jgi:general secretion pathway protein A
MYTAYFGLVEPPFSITPDPRYLYMSGAHREALAHLLYGIGEGGGFVQLTGEIGTGKTTLCRCLLEQLPPGVNAALILNPKLTDIELLAALCDELGIPYSAPASSRKLLVDALYQHLLDAHARGERTVLIVDEAQDLAPEVLEQIRLLTNLETPTRKLLQIILIGQPELIRLLGREDLRQLAQRVTARYHLLPFAESDTRAYVLHRMAVAGQKEEVFTETAMREAHRAAGGVPRLINAICDRALLGAYALDQRRVDVATVRHAAAEVQGHTLARRRKRPWRWAGAVALVVALIAGASVLLANQQIRLPWGAGRAGHGPVSGSPALAGPTLPSLGAAAPGASPASAPGGSTVSVTPPGTASGEPAVSAALPAAAPGGGPVASSSPPADPAANGGAASPAKPADPVARLGQLLSDPKIRADKEAAFASLYARWGLDFDGSKHALGCARGKAEGLECLFRTGTWAKLRRFDLPAIIELSAPSGDRRYATVVALDEHAATVDFGSRRYTFPLSEIDHYWEGAFIVLWKAPGAGSAQIVPGTRGTDVEWLRQRLSALDGAPPGGQNRDFFDDELRSRVVAFQRSRSLLADGIVGEETLAQLDPSRRDSRAPRLWRAGP